MTRTGRPRRTEPARRFNLTLSKTEHDLLAAYAQELGQPPTRVAGDLLRKILYGAQDQDGRVDQGQVEAMLRALRGESDQPAQYEPIWEWPIEAILADARWWDRWLPDLNELLGRKLAARKDPQGRRDPVLDRRGYADVMEFLFPAVATPTGTVTWRSPQYPHLVSNSANEAGGDVYHLWESVIRHLATALEALQKVAEPKTEPTTRILVQDQITGPWLRTLKNLIGEGPPHDALPQNRLT
jgi:hypothetical protein